MYQSQRINLCLVWKRAKAARYYWLVFLIALIFVPLVCSEQYRGQEYVESTPRRRDMLSNDPWRIVYLDTALTTQNDAALSAAANLGMEYSCDDPNLALPECFIAENWKYGWVGQFMWGVLQELGMGQNVIAMTQANFTSQTDPRNSSSVYQGSSAFTRCVWEVYLGHVDLCIGDFWETTERRNISTFTTLMAVDRFLLITLTAPSDPLSVSMFPFPLEFKRESLYNIFKPLHWTVWTLSVGLVFIAGPLLWVIEASQPVLEGKASDEWHLQGLLSFVYEATQAFWSAGSFRVPRAMGGKIAVMGLSFHFFLVMASYTASLANFLADGTGMGELVRDFSDVRADRQRDWLGKLCMLEAALGLVPIDPGQIVVLDSYGSLYESLHQGKCGAAVTGANEFLTFAQGEYERFSVCIDPTDPRGSAQCQTSPNSSRLIDLRTCNCADPKQSPGNCPQDCPDYLRYCNVVPAADQGDFQYSFNWALPVRQDLAELISSAILYCRLRGDLISSRQQQLINVVPLRCSVASSAAEKPSTKVTVEGLTGVYIYSTVLIVAGLCLHAWQLHLEAARKNGNPERLDRSDGNFTAQEGLHDVDSGPTSSILRLEGNTQNISDFTHDAAGVQDLKIILHNGKKASVKDKLQELNRQMDALIDRLQFCRCPSCGCCRRDFFKGACAVNSQGSRKEDMRCGCVQESEKECMHAAQETGKGAMHYVQGAGNEGMHCAQEVVKQGMDHAQEAGKERKRRAREAGSARDVVQCAQGAGDEDLPSLPSARRSEAGSHLNPQMSISPYYTSSPMIETARTQQSGMMATTVEKDTPHEPFQFLPHLPLASRGRAPWLPLRTEEPLQEVFKSVFCFGDHDDTQLAASVASVEHAKV